MPFQNLVDVEWEMCLSWKKSVITKPRTCSILIGQGLITCPTPESWKSYPELMGQGKRDDPCNRQFLKWLLAILAFWYLCLCVFLSPWVEVGPGLSLLTNRIKERLWYVISVTILHKTVISFLLSNPLYCLLNFYTLKQAAMLEESIWQRTEGNLQPIVVERKRLLV